VLHGLVRLTGRDIRGGFSCAGWRGSVPPLTLTSGIGPRLGARIAVEIGSISRFRTPGHLAAYAGLGPTPWKAGTSINANVPSRFGNHRLKNALLLAAFASLRHTPSRTYYDRLRLTPTHARLTDQSVALIVKRCVVAIAQDPRLFAGHSLRAGLARSAAAGGATARDIMQQTRHRGVAMVRR
jgi:Transposase IS116/IS110/IS902 family